MLSKVASEDQRVGIYHQPLKMSTGKGKYYPFQVDGWKISGISLAIDYVIQDTTARSGSPRELYVKDPSTHQQATTVKSILVFISTRK